MSSGPAAALGAKAHVLYSRLLHADEYWALLNKTSVAEIAAFLKQTEGYKDKLRDIIPEQAHRTELEKALRASLYIEAESCYHYMDENITNFFSAWLGSCETAQLKGICRWICSGRTRSEQMKTSIYHIPNSELPYDKLFECRDLKEVIDSLKGTKYYPVLCEPVRKFMAGNASMFDIETAVDKFAVTDVMGILNNLPEEYRSAVAPLFGAYVDLTNICHFHRCMRYFNMSLEETLSLLLPTEYKITRDFLRDLAKIESQNERLALIERKFPEYGRVFRAVADNCTSGDGELELETALNKLQYKMAAATFKKGTPGFHTAVAYFILRATEIADIIKIIEAVRYGKESSAAVQYLTRPLLNKSNGGE